MLVLRVAGQVTDAFERRAIPFYYMSELGEKGTIRGFDRSRYRDRDRLIASVEYRYPVWRTVDWVLFLDAGQVTHRLFDTLSRDDFAFGYGGGFRIWSPRGVIMRFEVGKSADRVRLYLVLNED